MQKGRAGLNPSDLSEKTMGTGLGRQRDPSAVPRESLELGLLLPGHAPGLGTAGSSLHLGWAQGSWDSRELQLGALGIPAVASPFRLEQLHPLTSASHERVCRA